MIQYRVYSLLVKLSQKYIRFSFTLRDIFWNVSVLHGGGQGMFPSQLPVMQSNIPVYSAKLFLMALKSTGCSLEITYPASASAQLCRCCGGFLLSREWTEGGFLLLLQLSNWLERCNCRCHESLTWSVASARGIFWSKCWSPGLGAITKEDKMITPNCYGLYVRLSHHFMWASWPTRVWTCKGRGFS